MVPINLHENECGGLIDGIDSQLTRLRMQNSVANVALSVPVAEMDDLDKQLAELQLINNSELPPNPSVVHGSLGKKVGPAVPPKPKKQQQPLVSSYFEEVKIIPMFSVSFQFPKHAETGFVVNFIDQWPFHLNLTPGRSVCLVRNFINNFI